MPSVASPPLALGSLLHRVTDLGGVLLERVKTAEARATAGQAACGRHLAARAHIRDDLLHSSSILQLYSIKNKPTTTTVCAINSADAQNVLGTTMFLHTDRQFARQFGPVCPINSADVGGWAGAAVYITGQRRISRDHPSEHGLQRGASPRHGYVWRLCAQRDSTDPFARSAYP